MPEVEPSCQMNGQLRKAELLADVGPAARLMRA